MKNSKKFCSINSRHHQRERAAMRHSGENGSSIVEAVCGGMIMIALCLAFVDTASVIAAQYVADAAAYNVCRAAASSANPGQAQQQAQSVLTQGFQPSGIVPAITLANVDYQSGSGSGNTGSVTVKLQTTVSLIAPIPLLGNQVIMHEQYTLPLLVNLNS